MKRFCAYNGLVGIAFFLLWLLLVVVEVKVRLYWFESYIFFGSLALVFPSFLIASWRALLSRSKNPFGDAAVASLFISLVFIFVSVLLLVNFKWMIGGHI